MIKNTTQIISNEATDSSKSSFLATHVPFKHIKYADSGVKNIETKEITEKEFLDNILLQNLDEHKFIAVIGSNGSGKSHMIRLSKEYYENHVNKEDEVILFIPRNQNTLKGTIKQLLESDVFSDNFNKEEIKKFVNAKEHLDSKELKSRILHEFAMSCERDEEVSELIAKKHKKRIREFLLDSAIMNLLSRENGPIDRIMKRLIDENTSDDEDKYVEAEFRQDDFKIDIDFVGNEMKDSNKKAYKLGETLAEDKEVREDLSKYLNSKLTEVVENTTSLRATDLKNIFEKLRIELKKKGKNLALFIEDITAFTGLDQGLIDVLITKNTEDNDKYCRIVSLIGITDSYYLTTFRDNLKDRITARIEMDEAILTNSRETAEMAARYLNVLNLGQGAIDHWLQMTNGNDSELPICDKYLKHKWSNIVIEDGREFSLYPFNERSLWNLYLGIEKKNRTPREFLKRVLLKLTKEFKLYGEEKFPPNIDDLKNYFEIPSWEDIIHGQRVDPVDRDGRLATLFLFWGNRTIYRESLNNEIYIGGLSQDVFKSFNLEFDGAIDIPNQQTEKPKELEAIQQPIQKEVVEDTTSTVKVPITTTQPNTKSSVNREKEYPQISKEQKEFNDIEKELNKWVKGEELGRSETIREDLFKIINENIDWEKEGIPQIIVQNILTTRLFAIEGQKRDINKNSYIIKRDVISYRALVAISAWRYLGKKSWDIENKGDHISNLFSYVESIKDSVIKYVKDSNKINTELSNIPRWVIAGQYYVQVIRGNISLKDNNINSIYEKLLSDENCNIELNLENRTDLWKQLYKMIDNGQLKNLVDDNYTLVSYYFNCIQGCNLATKKYFQDAKEILEIISELDTNDWKIDIEEVKKSRVNSDDILNKSKSLLIELYEKINEAIDSEKQASKKLLDKVVYHVGEKYEKDNLKQLFDKIELMFNKFNQNSVNYRTDDSRLNTKAFDYLKMDDAISNVKKALEANTNKMILTYYSENTNNELSKYIKALDDLEILINNNSKSINKEINNLKSNGDDINQIIDQIKTDVNDIKISLDCINRKES